MKVFLMFVYCLHGSQCEVKWARAIYPTIQECTEVAPTFLRNEQVFGKRPPTGIFCEVAGSAPKTYSAPREHFQ